MSMDFLFLWRNGGDKHAVSFCLDCFSGWYFPASFIKLLGHEAEVPGTGVDTESDALSDFDSGYFPWTGGARGNSWFLVFFHSRLYHVVLLTLLSLLQLSNGIVRLLGRRTNPSLIFASSFLIFILIGAALLMLPRATYHGISFIDALFTATSATCVTGLVSVDVSSTFTPEGLFIIIMLIQIGGLGVMTLTSFFAMFLWGILRSTISWWSVIW